MLVRMVIIKTKRGKKKMVRMWRKGNSCRLLVRLQVDTEPIEKTVWRLLKKLKTELPYDPVIPLLEIYSSENTNSKRYLHSYVHSSIIYNS